MLPTIDEALKELEIAGGINPGPWTKHSENVGIAARNIAERIPGMDAEKAYILGLLHDIGRRVKFGPVDIPTHVYEGYKYCMKKGWDEVARICMTHSYLRMSDEFDYAPESDNEKEIKKYILNCEADDYDRLIQLCDSLATDYGFVILEKRFVDVTRRYGIMDGYIKGWEIAFDIKEHFEAQMGCSIYDVLPDIGKTTLLTPKPWRPPLKLICPTMEYADAIQEYRREFLESGDSMDGCGYLRKYGNSQDWIDEIHALENIETTPPNWVTCSQFILVRTEDNKMLGSIQIRHHLNDFLEKFGGHIGYSVCPSERRKGYATQMLRSILPECAALGIDKVLITCNQGNEGSKRTILKNGGVYESTVYEPEEGVYLERYWIDLVSPITEKRMVLSNDN